MDSAPTFGAWRVSGERPRDARGVWFDVSGPRGRRGRLLWVEAPSLLTPAARMAFLSSARAAAALHAPALVPVLESGEEQGRPFVILPPASGSGWDELAGAGLLSLSEVDHLARTLFAAYSAALRQGVPHGPLRAADVRRTPAGEWSIEGWGLSGVEAVAGDERANRTLLADQPEYVCPDLMRADPVSFAAADQYAVGALLYHALTGRAPFTGGAADEVMSKPLFSLLEDPMEIRPQCPPAWAATLERLMARQPADRFATFEQAGQAWASGPDTDPESIVQGIPPGRSVLRRSVKRAPHSAPREAKVFSASGKSLVLSAPPPQAGPARRVHRDLSGLRVFLLMALIVAGLLVAWREVGEEYGLPPFPFPKTVAPDLERDAEEDPRDVPAPPAARPPATAPAPAPRAPAGPPRPTGPAGPATPDAPTARPTTHPARPPAPTRPAIPAETAGLGRLPGFADGQRLFNEAVRIFDVYRVQRTMVPGLERVPTLAEQAAARFETARQQATPEEAQRLSGYIDQSYRLAMAARQALLMHHAEADRSSSVPLSPDRPAPRRPVVLPPAPPVAGVDHLLLARGWQLAPLEDSPAHAEVRRLLNGRAQAQIQTAPQPDLFFVPGVPYLAASGEAEKALGLLHPLRQLPVQFGPYPPASFTAIEYVLPQSDDFDAVRLIVDGRDRVAAIQMIGGTPREQLWLPAALLDTRWRMTDLVTGEEKPLPTLRVGHRLRVRDGLLVIDTELASEDGQRSLERRSLLLPQPMADLLWLRLNR
jgi:hypothetical protein